MPHVITCPICRATSRIKESAKLPIRCACGHVMEDRSAIREIAAQSVIGRGVRYGRALARWIAAGSPLRSDERVNQILADHCYGCELFTGQTCGHKRCGCQIRSAEEDSQFGIAAPFVNKLRMATESCPDGKWGAEEMERQRVDVVVLLTAANPLWDISPAIRRLGLTAETIDLRNNRLDNVRKIMETRSPKLVVNRSFCVGWDVIETLSEEYPQTQFVTVNHSSQAHLLTHPHWLRSQSEFLRLAIERPNCWLASPDERVPLREVTGCERAIWLPNLVELPPFTVTRNRLKVPTVSLVGRRDLVKNFPTQILAAGIVNRRKPLKLLIVTKGGGDDFARLAEQCGIDAEVFDWEDQRSYLALIGQRVDVGLQASFSESFNYVALDHLSLGIPVVGSPAIRYLPREWQASPDDPASIALTLARVLEDRDAGHEARRIANRVAGRNERAFEAVIRSLAHGLGKSEPLNSSNAVNSDSMAPPSPQITTASQNR